MVGAGLGKNNPDPLYRIMRLRTIQIKSQGTIIIQIKSQGTIIIQTKSQGTIIIQIKSQGTIIFRGK